MEVLRDQYLQQLAAISALPNTPDIQTLRYSESGHRLKLLIAMISERKEQTKPPQCARLK
jgi:hypothetical protein